MELDDFKIGVIGHMFCFAFRQLFNCLSTCRRLHFGNSFLPHVYFILSKPRFFQKDNRNIFYIFLGLDKSNGFMGHMSHYALGQFYWSTCRDCTLPILSCHMSILFCLNQDFSKKESKYILYFPGIREVQWVYWSHVSVCTWSICCVHMS